jgi:flagellar basal-body rod modification protein FlgD
MDTTIQDSLFASSTQAGPLAATNATQIQDRFLTLLVTQLKNQDPLRPMDNSQITTQLSQISTVSGIDKLNDTVAGLATALAANQTMSSAALIGRQVLAPGATLSLAQGQAAGAVELAQAADRVTLTVIGPAGNVVRRLELGPSQAGLQPFAWDGTADDGRAAQDGSYTYRIDAVSADKSVDATAYQVGTVTGIAVAGKDPTVIVNGLTEVRFADVQRIQ